ncbi:tRNA (adenosine(37)-N6)-threonylcarbamoyltransferase complex dimerization subunit type 1 TsaB [Oceanobacillus sp. Castelsardo]|uniref:tRNA (adenosine(37)-N6)-threonylcarbamoyltransferase complex dimerization subunit type 1 TsaB n=1 Tax=Oceanobacillus sp. Castelsardo TaxID=1851204 RepID=UPI0008382E3E|nr:tRNA (adenosine(37)-N6)-threonylcarbamoyltransferase complex dimerization subunit type 1 TsaB [Oceanobacillus sp. Castelsardo]
MNVLAIDTSNQVMGVALLKDEEVVGEIVTNIAKNHSVRLMPAIEKLMAEVSLTPADLDKIVVAKGPGSYTGVRIGLSIAKSMAWALGIPVVGVSSLEVLAYQGRFFDGYVFPFFDARRGLVYAGVYEFKDSKLRLVYEEKNLPMEDALLKLKGDNKKVLCLSPELIKHKDTIQHVLGDLAIIPEGPFHLANPGFLGLSGLYKEGDNTHTLTPNYLRLAEAEAKWLQAQKENK